MGCSISIQTQRKVCSSYSQRVSNIDLLSIIDCSTATRSQINIKWLWTKIKTLNLFDSQSNDILKIRHEQYTTRLFIILLFLIFFILFFYTTFSKQKYIFTINRPTQATCENLHMKYGDTIECPCSNTAISYEKFISIDTTYHQICSTGFTSQTFIDQLYGFNRTKVHRADFMALSSVYFTWIASFCGLCRVVIYNLYNFFQKELFVNAKLFSSIGICSRYE